MAKRIMVMVSCGLCGVEGEQGGEDTYFFEIKMSVNGLPEKVLDACENCAQNSPLNAILEAAYDVKSPKKTQKPKISVSLPLPAASEVKSAPVGSSVILCGVDGCSYTSNRSQSVGVHRRLKHGIVGNSHTKEARVRP